MLLSTQRVWPPNQQPHTTAKVMDQPHFRAQISISSGSSVTGHLWLTAHILSQTDTFLSFFVSLQTNLNFRKKTCHLSFNKGFQVVQHDWLQMGTSSSPNSSMPLACPHRIRAQEGSPLNHLFFFFCLFCLL